MKKTIFVVLWVLSISGLGLSCANAQIKWEQDTAGWSWVQDQTFWSELTLSLHEFFGDAVGAFLLQPFNVSHTAPAKKWALISTQFLQGGTEKGTWDRGTIINGQWRLYAFSTGSGVTTAFVTPIHDTRVVAAAMDAGEYRHFAPTDLDDQTAFMSHVLNGLCGPLDMKCQRADITIFFKDKFDFNPQISHALRKLMSKSILSSCKQLRVDAIKMGYVSKYGKPPPHCRVRVDIMFVNELPHE